MPVDLRYTNSRRLSAYVSYVLHFVSVQLKGIRGSKDNVIHNCEEPKENTLKLPLFVGIDNNISCLIWWKLIISWTNLPIYWMFYLTRWIINKLPFFLEHVQDISECILVLCRSCFTPLRWYVGGCFTIWYNDRNLIYFANKLSNRAKILSAGESPKFMWLKYEWTVISASLLFLNWTLTTAEKCIPVIFWAATQDEWLIDYNLAFDFQAAKKILILLFRFR